MKRSEEKEKRIVLVSLYSLDKELKVSELCNTKVLWGLSCSFIGMSASDDKGDVNSGKCQLQLYNFLNRLSDNERRNLVWSTKLVKKNPNYMKKESVKTINW